MEFLTFVWFYYNLLFASVLYMKISLFSDSWSVIKWKLRIGCRDLIAFKLVSRFAIDRWRHTGDEGTLEYVVCFVHKLVDCFVPSLYHEEHNELVKACQQVYRSSGDRKFLNLYITLLEQAVEILSFTVHLSNYGLYELDCFMLGDALRERYCNFTEMRDLEPALRFLELATKAPLYAHDGFDLSFQKTARSRLAYLYFKSATDTYNSWIDDKTSSKLEEALKHVRAVLLSKHLPFTKEELLQMKKCLASLLHQRYQSAENPVGTDLEEALKISKEIDKEIPEDFNHLCVLANILMDMYRVRRDNHYDYFKDGLEISRRIGLLEAARPNSKRLAEHIQAVLHGTRYASSQAEKDLEIAIESVRKAYAVDPELNRDLLARALWIRSHKLFAHHEDLEEAHKIHNEAPSANSMQTAERDILHRSLNASILATKGMFSGDVSKRAEAIKEFHETRNLSSPGSTSYIQQTWKLGRLYREDGQLELALELLVYASQHMNPDTCQYARCLHDLGYTYVDLAAAASINIILHNQVQHYFSLAADALSRALFSTSGECSVRTKSGLRAGLIFYSQEDWRKSYSHLSTTIELFPILINRQLSMKDQQEQLKGLTEVSVLAAAAALKLGKSPLEALKIMESGRGIIVSQMLRLKEDNIDLMNCNPRLHQRYSELQQTLLKLNHIDDESPVSLQIERSSQRTDALKELETLTKEIGDIPGLSTFSHLLTDSDLERIANTGSVVVFNTPYSSANPEPLRAFLIKAGAPLEVRVIDLPDLSPREAIEMANSLTGPGRLALANGLARADANDSIQKMLAKLWNTVVEPILAALDLLTPVKPDDIDTLPRIWWIASGVMGILPLHAAGIFNEDDNEEDEDHETYTGKFVVSSYAATLRALLSASRQSQQRRERSSKPITSLLVAMPKTAELNDLPSSEQEVQDISQILCPKEYKQYTSPTSNDCTTGFDSILHVNKSKEDVLRGLTQCTIAHFACHGTSNLEYPSSSGLHLGTSTEASMLSVHEISELQGQHTQLAYLSACSTAQNGDEGLVNEVLHVATAFQLAGFPHVVGTLWEVRDSVAIKLAKIFYENLKKQLEKTGGEFEDGVVARAVHITVQKRRAQSESDFLGWTSLVHYGC